MIQHWQHALETHWNISAELTQLDGEYDLNFKASSGHVLKVMRPGCDAAFIDMQTSAIDAARKADADLPLPDVITTGTGALFLELPDENGETRLCWVLSLVAGRPWAKFRPHAAPLIADLGAQNARLTLAMSGFEHPELHRDFKWNLMDAGWIKDDLDVIKDASRNALISDMCRGFADAKAQLNTLPRVAIHNDLNDYNILVSGSLSEVPHVSGLIDFGDMCIGPRIVDLAITAAYLVLGDVDAEKALVALVRGYHSVSPLTPQETDLIWPLLKMRLAVSVVNSTVMAAENPDDPYVTISQAPAWKFLEHHNVNEGLINARLRAACDLPVTDAADRVMAWLASERGNFAPVMSEDLSQAPLGSLSVEACATPQNPFDMPLAEAAIVGKEYEQDDGEGSYKTWLGYYNEPRLVYADLAFRKGPYKASDRRTVHLAIDAFAPAGRKLLAPCDGEVFCAEYRAGHLDYGGVIILKHQTPEGDDFYTLYGHLNPEFKDRLNIGDKVAKGEAFCQLGDPTQNGGWAPHVHFQLALSTDGMGEDWPGVGDPDEMFLWERLCPNPAMLMNLPDDYARWEPTDKSQVLADRDAYFGKNLKLSYSNPAMLVRGWKHHMFDEWGRPYLDAYNNVPHVGHAHPRIQSVAADQLKRMNSNTRYLHPAQVAFAEKIRSKLPDPLNVCFFVNSGTEANELALRLSRTASGNKGMVTPNHGYHGNTTGAIDISAYKFNAKGGVGQADWVELVEVADDYKGRFGRDDNDAAQKYADLVDDAIIKLQSKGHGVAGFIAETFPSVGGQIIPPKGYLPAVYDKIRAAGGICIADEVQTGLGRLGEYYFAFEHQGAVPDIVVLGKPIGNGHPLGVVITTREIADKFAQGPEYFSTFGGSTLSCRMGKEVLDIVDDEGLQENARARGAELMSGLKVLMEKYDVIGDIRGMGLFIGVELVTDHMAKTPATEAASYVVNRLREHRILTGREGQDDNILKIRPPLTIDAEDIDMLIGVMDKVLKETTCLMH
ncbi:aminotransferase class III-fold pyridoxal phosphate-dependent enzyme [Halocynthiibacter namhaensis]|uniref:aminotransferase class III-fold pyridoxal phosphate-dependent enzyme n=1 Tax=Halocynthiibacter namhaensis TaxID=1290553 RepID=UPI00057993EB|nr:aminotransferase class III-fold pyridoxal phosphate-dependent enzyme [Halocynthiibacter namhaensis]